MYRRAAPWAIQGDLGEINRNRNPLHPYFGTAEMTSIEFLQILNFFEQRVLRLRLFLSVRGKSLTSMASSPLGFLLNFSSYFLQGSSQLKEMIFLGSLIPSIGPPCLQGKNTHYKSNLVGSRLFNSLLISYAETEILSILTSTEPTVTDFQLPFFCWLNHFPHPPN